MKHLSAEKFQYKYCILMPHGDQNLEMIYRCEQPDINRTVTCVTSLANDLEDLHERNLYHCDLKIANIVRFREELKIIDMDASAEKMSEIIKSDGREDKFYAGKKFSSGILPPEMVHFLDGTTVKGRRELQNFEKYFKEIKETDEEKWNKLQPVKPFDGKGKTYMVKTFLSESKEKMEKHILGVRRMIFHILLLWLLNLLICDHWG